MTATAKRRGRPPKQRSEAAEDQGWKSNDEQEENGATRQQFIEGTEPVSVPEIDEAAKKYLSLHNSRMKTKEKEDAANENLVAAMKEHELAEYRFEGHLVKVKKGAEKAKVKRIDRETQEEQEDEE